jgi:hypothetical protein
MRHETRRGMRQGFLSGIRGGGFTSRQKEKLERLTSELPASEKAALFAHFERIRRGYLALNYLLSTETTVSKIEGFDVEGRIITVRMRDGNRNESDI